VFFTGTRTKRLAAGLVAASALTISLAACSSGSSDAKTSSDSAPKVAKPVASIPALTGKSTAVKLDKGFTDALTSLKLTPGVVGTAKLVNGSLVFPITGGNVTYFKPGTASPYVVGQVQHEGSGLSLAAGGTKVTLTNLNVDPTVSRVYGDVAVNGKVAATSAYLFKLDGRTLQPLKTQGTTAILQGTKVEISDVAAPVLNKVFKTDAVKPGLLVGIAKITVNTK
jgi:hypothetical protein